MFRIRKAISKQGGFSIAEVTMAMFLFTASVLGVSFMMLQGSSGINRGRLETIASNLGQRKIEEVKSLPFYVPYDSEAGNKDIDDFYYNPAVSNPNQPSNPLSTAPAYEDYGTIPGFSKFKRVTTVQYQYVSGGVMTPAYMDPNWRPKNATPPQFDRPMGGPNGGPYDVLHALIIKVTVYYQTENGEKTFVVQGIAGDLLITGGTNSPLLVVNSISPTTGYYLYDTNLKMTINVTTPPGTLGPSSTLDVFLWYPGEADVHAKPAPTANSNGTQITCYFDLTDPNVKCITYNIAVYWQDRGVLDKSLRDAFTVTTPPPVITGIGNFNWGYRKQDSRQVTIYGNYLLNPTSVQLIGPNPNNTFPITGQIQSSTNTQIVVRFNLVGDATTRPANSRWNLRVTTAGGTDTSDSDAERLWMNPPPQITRVTPSNPPNYYDWTYKNNAGSITRNIRIEGQYLYGLYYVDGTYNTPCAYLRRDFGAGGIHNTGPASFVSGPYNNDCTADEPVIMAFSSSSGASVYQCLNTRWQVVINNYGGINMSDDVDSEKVWMNPPPQITSISGWPSPAYTGSRQGNVITNLTVNGSYFQTNPGGTATFYLIRGTTQYPPPNGTTYLVLSGGTFNNAGTQLTGASVNVYVNPMNNSFLKWYNAGAQTDNTLIAGNYYLTVFNGDSQYATLGTAYALNHAQYTIYLGSYQNTAGDTLFGKPTSSTLGPYYQDWDNVSPSAQANNSLALFLDWRDESGNVVSTSNPGNINVSDLNSNRTFRCRYRQKLYDNASKPPGVTWIKGYSDDPYEYGLDVLDSGYYWIKTWGKVSTVLGVPYDWGECSASIQNPIDVTNCTKVHYSLKNTDGSGGGHAVMVLGSSSSGDSNTNVIKRYDVQPGANSGLKEYDLNITGVTGNAYVRIHGCCSYSDWARIWTKTIYIE